jgi:hypothetical protein
MKRRGKMGTATGKAQVTLIHETDYGFAFGPVIVERHCALPDGSVILSIATPKHYGRQAIDIRVTKTGFVRISGVVENGTWKPQIEEREPGQEG